MAIAIMTVMVLMVPARFPLGTLLCGDTPCVSKAKEKSTRQTNLSFTKTKLDKAEVEVNFGCSV